MALPKMAFSPATGLRDTATYPSNPVSGAAAREQVQGRMDEIQDYLNDTLTATLDTDIAAKDNVLISFVDVTTSRDFATTDLYKKVRCNHASVAINMTMPSDASFTAPVGAWIIVEQTGAAQAAVVAGSGATIKPATKLKVNGQDTSAVLTKESANTWSWQGSVKA